MPSKHTVRYPDDADILSVRALQVEVVDGQDKGLQPEGDIDVVSIGTGTTNTLVLTDPTVSEYHAELLRTPEGIVLRDHGSTNGTFVSGIRIKEATVPAGVEIKVGRSALRVVDGQKVEVEVHGEEHLGELWGRSESMRRLMARMRRAAMTDAPILIVGKSGTGKELIARAVHDLSARQPNTFITVDCGAMSPNLVASELFGHERGAFTGADRQHIGAFERANGGTIFLDEIGELPNELQPILLGALERRRFHRVGGQKEISVDVRVLAATNRDLRSEVNASRFRLDLYYRLAVVSLQVPALRERPEDIDVLVKRFLEQCGDARSVSEVFDAEVMAQLQRHAWPGNVRELRNLVEATLAMGEAPTLPREEAGSVSGSGSSNLDILSLPYKEARAAVLHDFESHYLKHWLEQTEGNVAKASREARMDRSHLFQLLRRHNLR